MRNSKRTVSNCWNGPRVARSAAFCSRTLDNLALLITYYLLLIITYWHEHFVEALFSLKTEQARDYLKQLSHSHSKKYPIFRGAFGAFSLKSSDCPQYSWLDPPNALDPGKSKLVKWSSPGTVNKEPESSKAICPPASSRSHKPQLMEPNNCDLRRTNKPDSS